MKIYILEDDKIHLSLLKEIIEKIKFKENFKFEIMAFTNSYDFLNNLYGNNNVYFLDIKLNEKVNGVDVATKIREIDFYGHIIFVTSYSNYVNQAIENKTAFVDYVVKSIDIQKFEKRIYSVIKYILLNKSNKKILSINLNCETIMLEQNKIEYITTLKSGLRNSKKLEVKLINSKYEFYGTLKNILQSLNEDFIQVNKSTIVNKNYIHKINYKEKIISLKNSFNTKFSKKYIKNNFEI